MLSNPLHRFSTYNALPSNNMLSNGHVQSSHNHMHGSGLDTLAHGSQYALQQLQQHVDVHQNSQVHRGHNVKHRQHPYGMPAMGNGRASNGTGASGPIRRRISRACDQCNQLRTKCDGQSPCAHCVGEFFHHDCKKTGLMEGRVRIKLRIHSGEKEARESLTERPGPTGRCSSSKWSKISHRTIFRR